MKRGSFFFRVEFCLKTAQKERRRQKAVFRTEFQKFHTICQKTVFDIRMLKMSRLHHGTRHVEINDAVASSRFPKLERQCGFKFFLMQAKEHEGLSNYSITSSIRLLEYCGTVKGVKHSTASSISLHIYRFLWVFL